MLWCLLPAPVAVAHPAATHDDGDGGDGDNRDTGHSGDHDPQHHGWDGVVVIVVLPTTAPGVVCR